MDPTDFAEIVKGVDPDNVLIIIASKTFTTQETIQNAKLLKEWLVGKQKVKGQMGVRITEASESDPNLPQKFEVYQIGSDDPNAKLIPLEVIKIFSPKLKRQWRKGNRCSKRERR